MPAIIDGYEYDIFISYRHNDNKGGGLEEFVSLLKQELATTIKQPLSIYFDMNPADGLLENHHVDKSLEGKLKCLIFMPIISLTYCDPKSFAWQHEFCAFNGLAKEDQFGRDIKLANGNVASRILGIKIHDLDAEDKMLFEREFGGPIRGIDFIYREPGVNRPLKVTDVRQTNESNTDYANQLNKVANAVKEIITALNGTSSALTTVRTYEVNPRKKEYRLHSYRLFLAIVLLLSVCTLGYFLFRRSQNSRVPEKSIAVLPFTNLSGEPGQEYFSDGLTEELLNGLAKIHELKVIGRTSSFSFKGKNEDLRTIARKLGVANILEGSVRKSGKKIRITAQLISAIDGAQLWSQTYDRDMEEIFKVQDDISNAVVNELEITLLGVQRLEQKKDTRAYNLWLEGKYFNGKRSKVGYEQAVEKYKQALSIDSGYASAWASLASTYINQGDIGYLTPKEAHAKAQEAVDRALHNDPELSAAYSAQAAIHFNYDWDWKKADAAVKMALLLDPKNTNALSNAGSIAYHLGHFKEAIDLFKQAIAIDPLRLGTYNNLSNALFYYGDFREAELAVRKVLELSPGRTMSYYYLAILLLAQDKNEAALEAILNEPAENWKMFGLHLVYFKLNRRVKSDSVLRLVIEKYAVENAFEVAEAYAFQGDFNLAFSWLDRAYDNRDPGLTDIKLDPLLTNLHNDLRWKPFLKKMRLD